MNWKRRLIELGCAWLVFGLGAEPGHGCGPFFPNRLIGSDDAVLVAPEAKFTMEITRMQLVPQPSHRAAPSTNGYAWHTLRTELADLEAALTRVGMTPEQRRPIVERHRQERAKIVLDSQVEKVLRPGLNDKPRIPNGLPEISEGLPLEFADYFLGSIAWHEGVIPDARKAWETLLGRPPAQRPFKSTWAAFMLGKSWEEENRERAVAYFQQVRSLAKEGFADNLGLAAASLGWEARLRLQEKQYVNAIELYLEQAAAGDGTACESLRFAASLALRDPGAPLRALASNPKAQRVITAYVISGGYDERPIDVDGRIADALFKLLAKAPYISGRVSTWHKYKPPVLLWLEAVESAKVRDVESAEQLALAAYQAGKMDIAQRWIDRAKATPVAQWLEAKLLIRNGRLEEATALLAKVSKGFSPAPQATNYLSKRLEGNLFVPEDNCFGHWPGVSISDQSLGELGILRLTRRQYVEALDCLIRSTFWLDAAYVAERVLTVDELKTYVDGFWSADLSHVQANPTEEGWREHSPRIMQEKIRYLLARRLARENRRQEAGPYYPASMKAAFNAFTNALQLSEDKNLEKAQRAAALFEAAKIARTNGMELLGTEGEPDGAVYGGGYPIGSTLAVRVPGSNRKTLGASADEQQRAARHHPEPDIRFHYRYTAAALAWQAAQWMPDNSDETARVLCLGGSWIQNRDPKAADVFYKALVRRCRKTALGAEADRKRWFPALDEEGNFRAAKTQPGPKEETDGMGKD